MTAAAPRPGRTHRLIAVAAWIVLVGATVGWALAADVGPSEAATRLVDGITGNAWGPLAFLAVYLARPLFFFSATVLTVAGGFLFGAVGGIAIVVLASNGSALVAYGVARWLGAGAGADPAGDGRLVRWTRRLRERSFETVIVMRLLYLPYDLVSYLSGAARIHPVAFLAGTALGSAPATVAFVLAGSSLESFDGGVPAIDAAVLIVSGVLLVLGLVVAEVLRRRERSRDAAL